ncbi:MAG: M16 family metallopeptidase [Candidatus Bruticola sp.]
MIKKTELANGILVISEEIPQFASCSLGVWVQSGARCDEPGCFGMAHFLEHMLFKGTEQRTALRLAQDMDLLGGRMNAFTEQEQTCLYTVVLNEHISQAFEIVADMLVNSSFLENELRREKGVVCEEIKMVEDDTDELASDLFYASIWPNHPLGRPIQGNIESVQNFTRDALFDYLHRCYRPGRIIVAAAGGIKHEKLLSLAERYLQSGWLHCGSQSASSFTSGPESWWACPPGGAPQAAAVTIVKYRPTEQVSICCGWQCLAQNDKRGHILSVLDSVLGGSLSCRLFQEIREKSGLAYSVETFRSSYSDTGLFGVEVSASSANVAAVLDRIRKIFTEIAADGITADELERARQHIKSSYALGLESSFGRMSCIVQNERVWGHQLSLEELGRELDKVGNGDIIEFSREFFNLDKITVAAAGPIYSL